jgi:hypothetical protein
VLYELFPGLADNGKTDAFGSFVWLQNTLRVAIMEIIVIKELTDTMDISVIKAIMHITVVKAIMDVTDVIDITDITVLSFRTVYVMLDPDLEPEIL